MNVGIKNMLLGIFILGGITLLITTILFLRPTVGDGKQILFVRFSDIGNITLGTRVLFAGKPVGEVVSLEEIVQARDQPTDSLGRVYFYELTLRIDSSIRVYNIDDISIQTSGLLGEKSIAIVPRAPPKGIIPQRITHQPVYAGSIDNLQNALIEFSDLSVTMKQSFKQVASWMKDHGESVGTTVRSAGSALEEFEQMIQKLDEKETFANLGHTVSNIKTATDQIAGGKGTIGRLVCDEDLSLQINALMSKADMMMNDVNHYGVLFHLNKQWQRLRLQRISHINALQSPKSFQVYFQTEVDDINSSMSRISMLIDKAQLSPHNETILANPEFKRDFAELLQKAEELSNNLKLYNQQLSIGN